MANIEGVGSSVINDLGLKPKVDDAKKELGQRDFLKLLVAQMKNQDPLEPQTNGEFLAQLAQFSSSDGISKMQVSLENLSSSLQSNQALQASSLVGKKVFVPGNSGSHTSSEPLKGAFELPVSASNLSLSVRSASGELVRSIDLGIKPSGQHEFSWDGLKDNGEVANDGTYSVEVKGSSGNEMSAFKTLMRANVDSVTLGKNGSGIKLNVDGVGAIDLEQVSQIGN